MIASKTYSYDYIDTEDDSKNAKTMIEKILADPELPNLQELRIGCWEDPDMMENDCQPIIDGIVSHADKFSHISHLFIGDMDYDECEVSWIEQGNYSNLWKALPQLKELTIKGSNDLMLGEICHENLESITIICGGLPSNVLESIQNAKLPNLKKLLLYIGIEDYGFDGSIDTIGTFLEKADFPKLSYLGIVDSDIQDEITEKVLESKFMNQIHTLDLSCGTLTDKGGELLLNKIPSFPNIKTLDLHHHYLSDLITRKLRKLPINIDLSEQNEPEEYDGETYMYPMVTE